MDLASYRAFTAELARESGALITRLYGQPGLAVETKADASPVTAADRGAEELMRRRIAAAYPDHGIIGEEFGSERADAEFTWVLDPIDGTKSFITGVPLWGTLIALLHRGKPVLGVCRGAQLLNVCFGGSLYQDIGTQRPNARVHRDWNTYDRLHHEVVAEPGSWLSGWMGESFTVNTVHHQGLDRLGHGVVVEGRCPNDGIIEAIRIEGQGGWIYGVQWHPEFVECAKGDVPALSDGAPVLEAWLAEARRVRGF